MLKKHPKAGRLIRLPRSFYTVVGFKDGFFLVIAGKGKVEKMSEEMVMTHWMLVPKEGCEIKKSAPTQEYVNQYFRSLLEQRQEREYKSKILKGFTIEDEVVEGFEAIAE